MKRIAGNSSRVANLTLSQMQAIAPVMTIDQLFHIAINAKKDLFLETKHPVPSRGAVERELLAYLKAHQAEIEKSTISIKLMSFSKMAVRRFTSYEPMQLVKNLRTLRSARTVDVGIGVFLIRKHPEIVSQARDKGHRIHVWTVDSPEEAKWLAELCVDSIVTNKPGIIRQAFH